MTVENNQSETQGSTQAPRKKNIYGQILFLIITAGCFAYLYYRLNGAAAREGLGSICGSFGRLSRAAGADHGQEWHPVDIEQFILDTNRMPRMRTTLYADAEKSRREAALRASALTDIENDSAGKIQRNKKLYNLAHVV